MGELIYKEETFRIVGCCMEVHRELGKGHNEVQVLNYLAASKLQLGLLVNLGEDSLTWKRVVL